MPNIDPNVAELYRRKVERLSAAMALRGLIDHIVITLGAARGEVYAVLHGDLERVLAWAEEEGGRRLGAAGGFSVTLPSSRVTTRA